MVAMNNDPERKREREQIRSRDKTDEASQAIESEQQKKYRKLYLEQLRRRSCPGCGESDLTDIDGAN